MDTVDTLYKKLESFICFIVFQLVGCQHHRTDQDTKVPRIPEASSEVH